MNDLKMMISGLGSRLSNDFPKYVKANAGLLAGFALVMLAYFLLQPMSREFSPLEQSAYTLRLVNINKSNKWASIKDDGGGYFRIHSGNSKPSTAVLTFVTPLHLQMDFSIRESGKNGNVRFAVKHNGKNVHEAVVTRDTTSSFKVSVRKGDQLHVSADKNGATRDDHGLFTIAATEWESFPVLKYLFVPFVWCILFLILFRRHYTLLFVTSYVLFLVLISAERLNFGPVPFSTAMTYSLLLFSFAFASVLLYQTFTRWQKYRVAAVLSFLVAVVIFLIPLIYLTYALNFEMTINEEALYAILQSNGGESIEYISDFISVKYILLFLLIPGAVGFFLYRQNQNGIPETEKLLLMLVSVMLCGTALAHLSEMRVPSHMLEAYEKYNYELSLFKDIRKKRETGEIEFPATKKEKGETYIVVIGESLNKNHMGLYGYFRNTTPMLSELSQDSNMVVFDNAYSNHTHTIYVLQYSLTEANQYNKKPFYNSLSIIDVLQEANFETYWLTNQRLYGPFDNQVSVVALTADNVVSLNSAVGRGNETSKFDGSLVEEVKEILEEKTNKNRVIFVHLMGNHTTYNLRYPAERTVFDGHLQQGEFGKKAATSRVINHYDNSVAYNDFVVGSMLNELKNSQSVSAFLYLSDHADDVIRNIGHNVGQFTFDMTSIPMIVWCSDDYKARYPQRFASLSAHRGSLFSNDLLFSTLIGICNIETDRYASEHDLSSGTYNLDPKAALVLSGSRHYNDKANVRFWQRANAKYLFDNKLSSRVFPHRVNSVGKLKEIWYEGFRSFEVDVRFDDKKEIFQVGHNEGLMGVSLEEFLSHIDTEKIERMWLDFKNLNERNSKKALKRLQELDKKFGLKSKMIVESSTKDQFFKQFRDDKWHTSYYLPTSTIRDLITAKKNSEMNALANQIARQVSMQNVSAVSFEGSLYPFVKQFLEKRISKEIVYHIWYAPALADVDFPQKLKKLELYQNSRIKTLLAVYKSDFDL